MDVDGFLDLCWGERVEVLQKHNIIKSNYLKILHLLSFFIYNLNIKPILVVQLSFVVGLVLKPGRLLIDYSLINQTILPPFLPHFSAHNSCFVN